MSKWLAFAASAFDFCACIVNKLLEEGARVTVYDPFSMENAKQIFGARVMHARVPHANERNKPSSLLLW